MNNLLPTDDLKKYGIIDSDNAFTKKLSANDISRFLAGDTIIADNEKQRITFKLTDNNSELVVKLFEKEKSYKEILDSFDEDPRRIEYAFEREYSENKDEKNFTRVAFLMKDDMNIYSYDMVKDAAKLTQAVAERKEESALNTYKTELEKLKSFLLDKVDKYPEAAKAITNNINIISNEISNVNSIDQGLNKKASQTDVRLDVNDPDLYQDVNSTREREAQEEQEEKQRGFKR